MASFPKAAARQSPMKVPRKRLRRDEVVNARGDPLGFAAAAVAFLVSRRRGGAPPDRSDLDDATRWLTAK